jgi:hypothetical protein
VATVEQSEQVLDAYAQARGRPWTAAEAKERSARAGIALA